MSREIELVNEIKENNRQLSNKISRILSMIGIAPVLILKQGSDEDILKEQLISGLRRFINKTKKSNMNTCISNFTD